MTELPQQRTLRLPSFDYSSNGYYFVTICSNGRENVFGHVNDQQVCLSSVGRIVEEEWLRISLLRQYIEVDSYVIMPNHLHGILIFQDPLGVETKQPQPLEKPRSLRREPRSLGSVIAGMKATVTRRVSQQQPDYGKPLWQRNYYEHIISGQPELERVREYIAANPASWSPDAFNRAISGRVDLV